MAKTPTHYEVTLWPPCHHYNLPTVTGKPVDVELTITTEVTKEVESPLPQQKAPDHHSGPDEEAEHFPLQHKTPDQPSGSSVESKPSPIAEKLPVQPSESPGESELSESQLEIPAQLSDCSQEVNPF